MRFFLQMCRPITIWNHRIFLSGVPVVSENGAACLQRGRNRRFRRKKWAVAEAAARSYDRTAVSPCFLTIDCISRMTEGGSGVLFRAVKSTPNRPHATCSEPHFPALPEKAKSLVNILFTRLFALMFAVRRGLDPPPTHIALTFKALFAKRILVHRIGHYQFASYFTILLGFFLRQKYENFF